ncbi:MAG: hypothetical protein M3Y91_17770, partial [Actinomycetota bacterium]|nr:hypothetical protein [Actinomycetota bacterium]
AAVLGERRVRLGGVPAVLFSSLAVGQLVSWYWVLRRYTVGLGPAVNPLDRVPGGWQPPVPYGVLIPLIVVPTLALAVMGWFITLRRRPPERVPTEEKAEATTASVELS